MNGVALWKRFAVMLMLVCLVCSVQAADPDIQAIRKLAEKGDAWSQLNLGAAYDNGLGVKRDVEQALYWYQKAAEQGLAEAQFNLAHLLVSEEISAVAAAEWMQKAAEQGMPDAQYLMGVIYAEGIGVDADDDKAVAWLKKAIAQGQKEAEKYLKEHYRSAADKP